MPPFYFMPNVPADAWVCAAVLCYGAALFLLERTEPHKAYRFVPADALILASAFLLAPPIWNEQVAREERVAVAYEMLTLEDAIARGERRITDGRVLDAQQEYARVFGTREP